MQVTQTLAEGLRREYRVVVPATDLDARVQERLVDLKGRVRLNGFRPGKVPLDHLKRLYGKEVRAEAIEAAVREANTSIIAEHGFKLAVDPKVTMPEEEGAVAQVIAGKGDLAYSVELEILPKIELGDFKGIEVSKLTADVSEEEVNHALEALAEKNRPFSDKGEGANAEPGDKVTISFTGTIDGQPFEGGSGEDVAVLLGSKTFLPGFEDQLVGIAKGETRTVNARFPENYLSPELRGKDAVFSVTAKSVEKPGPVTVDDDFAKSFGMASLDKLREAVKDRLSREHAAVSRRRVKRALLDGLDSRYRFDLPPTLVEQEFTNVWRTVTDDLQMQGRTFADEGTTEEAARQEYRGIAERRVRLGLVVAEIGEKNNIKVSDDELRRALAARAAQFPGQEGQVWEHYRKNPHAMIALRAPIYEDKVVDFLLELVKVNEKTVSREELYKEDEETPTQSA
jgi:trigger factor